MPAAKLTKNELTTGHLTFSSQDDTDTETDSDESESDVEILAETSMRRLVPPMKTRGGILIRSASAPGFRSLRQMKTMKPTMNGSIVSLRHIFRGNVGMSSNDTGGVCPHRFHCAQNAFVKGFLRTFSVVFLSKATVEMVAAVLSGKPQRIAEIALSPDHSRCALWMAAMAATYRLVVCALRRHFQSDERWMHTLAGFLSGAFIAYDSISRVKLLSMFLFVRALFDLLKKLCAERKIAAIPYAEVAAFTPAQMVIVYAYFQAPHTVDRTYYRFISRISNYSWKQAFHTYCVTNPNYKFLPCDRHIHAGTCTTFLIKDWFHAVARTFRMYSMAHLVPALLLAPKHFIKSPTGFLSRKLTNTLRSCAFMATYVLGIKAPLCYGRNYSGADRRWHTLLGAFFAGLSLFVEHPKRRMELVLYVIPRAFQIIMRYTKVAAFRARWFAVLCFQLTIAAWMFVRNSRHGVLHLNSLNRALLRIVFGTTAQV